MTKQIEEELGLPKIEDALKEQAGEVTDEEAGSSEEVDSMANALQAVNAAKITASEDPMGTESHILETDEIYDEAMKAYKDLLDLGFNIESKHAGANAFTPAAKMLEIALKASQSKANKKLERIKAIMEKEQHDRDMQNNQEDGVIEGEGSFMAFRKDVLEKIRKGEI